MATATTTRIVTQEELKQHMSRESLWFTIHDKVYDVTEFMDEHPGGEEVLLEQAGKDASEIFDDVSHSADAKELMKNYLVGDLDEKDRKVDTKKEIKKTSINEPIRHFNDAEHSLTLTWGQWAVAVAISLVAGHLVKSYISA